MIYAELKQAEAVRITGNNKEFQGAKINDKNFIRLPWKDLKRPKEMAETSHSLASEYLIYTMFTPFKVNYPMNDESTLCDAGCFFLG